MLLSLNFLTFNIFTIATFLEKMGLILPWFIIFKPFTYKILVETLQIVLCNIFCAIHSYNL